MGLFNIYNKAKNHINKTYFSEKRIISFEAYNLLKKYVVNGLSQPNSLDTAYPKNLKMNVLKNVSQRSMKTFFINYPIIIKKIKKEYFVNLMSLMLEINYLKMQKKLLKQIKNDSPRYQEIDRLIEKLNQIDFFFCTYLI